MYFETDWTGPQQTVDVQVDFCAVQSVYNDYVILVVIIHFLELRKVSTCFISTLNIYSSQKINIVFDALT